MISRNKDPSSRVRTGFKRRFFAGSIVLEVRNRSKGEKEKAKGGGSGGFSSTKRRRRSQEKSSASRGQEGRILLELMPKDTGRRRLKKKNEPISDTPSREPTCKNWRMTDFMPGRKGKGQKRGGRTK